MEKRDLIAFRLAEAGDIPFLFKSILMGTYHGNKYAKGRKQDPLAPTDFFGSIEQDTFMDSYHKFLEHLLSRPAVKVMVACLVEDKDVILGFSVVENHILHWAFVKPDWRGIGLAKDLIGDKIQTVSGFTRVGDIIRRKKGWSFNPWS